jgi:hypothetical protein
LTGDLNCDQCRATWELYGDDPPCDECEPEIMTENVVPFRVFSMVCDQHIMGFGGPVGLNLVAVFNVMDAMGIKNQLLVATQVNNAYHKAMEARK